MDFRILAIANTCRYTRPCACGNIASASASHAMPCHAPAAAVEFAGVIAPSIRRKGSCECRTFINYLQHFKRMRNVGSEPLQGSGSVESVPRLIGSEGGESRGFAERSDNAENSADGPTQGGQDVHIRELRERRQEWHTDRQTVDGC